MSMDTPPAVERDLLRIRSALRGTSESPRPLADLDLPPTLRGLLDSESARMRPAAVLVPLIVDESQIRILLTQRTDSLRNHGGQISFPGGARDDGDASFAATALREAQEEVGLPPTSVEIVGYLDDYPVFSGYRITPVVGIIRYPFVPVLSQGEVSEVLMIPLAHLLVDRAFEMKVVRRNNIELPVYLLSFENHAVWGATAGILRGLSRLLLGKTTV